MMQRIKEFFKRPSTIAFLAFTALYAACMAFIFWGTWALDKSPVQGTDNYTSYPINDAARWFADVCAGGRFIPSDLMHVIGGMYFWQELQYALAAYLAALGVVFYLRGRRVPHLAAYGAGAAFGLMGYAFTLFSAGHLGWFFWMMYGPFAFGLVDRCVRKGKWRNWALLGAVLAWGSAQQSDMWLLFTVLTFFYGLWAFVRESRVHGWKKARFLRLLAGVGVTAACACAVGLPQFSHAITHDLKGRDTQIAESSGKEAGEKVDKSADERWRFCTNWSLPPEDTAEFVWAEIHGGSSDPLVSPSNPYKGRLGQQMVIPPELDGKKHPVTGKTLKAGEVIWGGYRQHSLYLGILTVLFAVAGIVGWWFMRRKPRAAGHERQDADHEAHPDFSDVPFWGVASVIVYLCALGCFTPFYRLVYALPLGGYLRAPVKFVHLLEFCVAVLAGYGIAWLHSRFGAKRAWVGLFLGALAVLNVINLACIDSKYCAVMDVSIQKAPNDAADDVIDRGGGKVFMETDPYVQRQIWADLQGNLQGAMKIIGESVNPNIPIQQYIQIVRPKILMLLNSGLLRPDDRKMLLTSLKSALLLLREPDSPLFLNDKQLMMKHLKMKAVKESFDVHLIDSAKSPSEARFFFVPRSKWLLEANEAVRLSPGKLMPIGYYSLQKDGIRKAPPDSSSFVLLQVDGVPEPSPKEEPVPDRRSQGVTLVSVLATFGLLGWGAYGALRRKRTCN